MIKRYLDWQKDPYRRTAYVLMSPEGNCLARITGYEEILNIKYIWDLQIYWSEPTYIEFSSFIEAQNACIKILTNLGYLPLNPNLKTFL